MGLIYPLMSETNHVAKVYSFVAVLYLQSVLHVMLFRPQNVFCTLTLAVPAACVLCSNMAVFFALP